MFEDPSLTLEKHPHTHIHTQREQEKGGTVGNTPVTAG